MRTNNTTIVPLTNEDYIRVMSYGKKDEALIISNEDNILVFRLKDAGALIEIDYSETSLFEEKFQNLLKRFVEDDRVYVRIRKSHGKIVEALPSQIFLTYELEASSNAYDKIKSVVDGLEETLRSGGLTPEAKKEIKEDLMHANNNLKKFNRRVTRAKKLLERYEQVKPTKVKRSFMKKSNPYHQSFNTKKLSEALTVPA